MTTETPYGTPPDAMAPLAAAATTASKRQRTLSAQACEKKRSGDELSPTARFAQGPSPRTVFGFPVAEMSRRERSESIASDPSTTSSDSPGARLTGPSPRTVFGLPATEMLRKVSSESIASDASASSSDSLGGWTSPYSDSGFPPPTPLRHDSGEDPGKELFNGQGTAWMTDFQHATNVHSLFFASGAALSPTPGLRSDLQSPTNHPPHDADDEATEVHRRAWLQEFNRSSSAQELFHLKFQEMEMAVTDEEIVASLSTCYPSPARRRQSSKKRKRAEAPSAPRMDAMRPPSTPPSPLRLP